MIAFKFDDLRVFLWVDVFVLFEHVVVVIIFIFFSVKVRTRLIIGLI